MRTAAERYASQSYKRCLAVGPRQTIITIYIDFFSYWGGCTGNNRDVLCLAQHPPSSFIPISKDAAFDTLFDILSDSYEISPEKPD